MCNKKVVSFNPWRQNAKWRKLPTDLTVTESKYVRNPIFLHIPTPHEQGQICIGGFMGKMCFGKISCVLKIPAVPQKKTENNRFRVPIHFATNRFFFETILPPPQLLHPTTCLCTHTCISNSKFSPRFEV